MELHIESMGYEPMPGETVTLEFPESNIKFVTYDGHHDHTSGEWHCYEDSAACYPI